MANFPFDYCQHLSHSPTVIRLPGSLMPNVLYAMQNSKAPAVAGGRRHAVIYGSCSIADECSHSDLVDSRRVRVRRSHLRVRPPVPAPIPQERRRNIQLAGTHRRAWRAHSQHDCMHMHWQLTLITLSTVANAFNALVVLPVSLDSMMHIYWPWTVLELCQVTLTLQVRYA